MDERTSLLPWSWRLRRNSSRRNPYEEIDKRGFVGRRGFKRPKPKVQRLGSRGRKSWGLRMPKIRIRLVSPLKLLARLRDAYVNMMMNVAGKRCVVGMAMGPVSSLGMSHPGRERRLESRVESPLSLFTDVELMYIEYLKRDPEFMRSVLSTI